MTFSLTDIALLGFGGVALYLLFRLQFISSDLDQVIEKHNELAEATSRMSHEINDAFEAVERALDEQDS